MRPREPHARLKRLATPTQNAPTSEVNPPNPIAEARKIPDTSTLFGVVEPNSGQADVPAPGLAMRHLIARLCAPQPRALIPRRFPRR
jgi:hypothetical protein